MGKIKCNVVKDADDNVFVIRHSNLTEVLDLMARNTGRGSNLVSVEMSKIETKNVKSVGELMDFYKG